MAPGGISSRQKSCNACVKSKRRCDKQTPTCGNCVRKRCPCSYGGKSDMQPRYNSANGSIGVDTVASPSSASYDSGFVLNDGGFSTAFDADVALPDATLQIDGTLESLLNSMSGSTFGDTYGLSDLLGRDVPMASSPTSKALTRPDYSRIAPVCDDYAPWQLADPSSRIAYAVNVFKNFHVTFAQNKSTIYMHSQLYVGNTPRWILQAFATCVLYTNQTKETRGFVLKILHENVNNLINTASGVSFTPREKLARVHALVVYQTICMFDGDISLGQRAENDLPILESWNEELNNIRDNLDDVAELDMTELRKRQPESWERWVFAESVRRTYIICHALKTFWDLLKDRGDEDNFGKWEYIHRSTLSRHLWTATNSFDFYRAWNEKPMWIISAFCFDEFLRTGKGDDIDDFALAFLTLSFGLDEVKTFCYETSRRLLE
ncbi:uncharacterized protein F4807DRAFT_207976 [Annulohypoxylon truncatum]|uniref:uncharacterized protein n=1 Tax=Annulohypoxylon truncatum TaxID=327061 RepID=UPI0020082B00|nr:uncharacterized protein F4807DRAFT_207976 [Annulohypoxylon truncatum]KAI1213989.1 hypothetical protein F4807DRAFT_207976 [Annulohypoxylon truncatum]